jgi:endonuclease I
MRFVLRILGVLCVLAAVARLAIAQSYDPPTSYYATATGTGATLKSQLHDIIDGHTVVSYDAARTALQVTDRDPSNPNRILLVYNRVSNTAAWDQAATWNREHTWPESRLGAGGRAVSDLFNLRASSTQVNSDRGNLHFGGAFGQTFGVKVDKGATVWYPGDADAGMIARQQFYMAVRYDGSDSGTSDLELVHSGSTSAAARLGDLSRLIEWHYAAPPDAFERRRNQVIYDSYQFNRNPFTDRPEFVWSVFVNQANDSSLRLRDGVHAANGGSVLNVDMGRVIVNGAVPETMVPVTLENIGNDGTYFEVKANDALARSSAIGRYNSFPLGGPSSKVLHVGMNPYPGVTDRPGTKTSVIQIDNLDITGGGGAGRAANDANDVINLNLTVLSHAQPSFSLQHWQPVIEYDFGLLAHGAAAPAFEFDIFNAPSSNFTANLDFDAIIASGETHAFSTTLDLFGGGSSLAPNDSRSFSASIDTTQIGSFSAVYKLEFSDEDLSGAADSFPLTLRLRGTVGLPGSADFDNNEVVDGADFLAWQRGHGWPATFATGDANSDGVIDGADLEIWSAQFGAGTPTVLPVPEPCGYVLALIAVIGGGKLRQVRQRCGNNR